LFELILPDGQINAYGLESFVQSFSQKYSDFQKLQIGLYPSPSRLTRGAYRDRHGRWVRDAVDAAVSAHASAQTNDAGADGEVVWS
jgi:hypothetical protein